MPHHYRGAHFIKGGGSMTSVRTPQKIQDF
ncbi:hypothetical protein MESS2_440082 [Mesorhizobium metallidurans STM 2683]|uniref:Uncharacterized protein n=1 Tax=Mesorhizobium metallidurans STM 2683 TaxID=1297569 RepID=M5ERQ2_9HYPH|nr:hypothetical protein MESS2_440082 [Mesorhizobium metallidurans STM 2683]